MTRADVVGLNEHLHFTYSVDADVLTLSKRSRESGAARAPIRHEKHAIQEDPLSLALSFTALAPMAIQAQSADGRTDWPGAGQLYVGTNYQPFDRVGKDQIQHDIDRMKQAGMKVVRMGDLAWDAFEPAEGKFDFQLFDWIMDRMQAAGLKVIMGIPGQPAPIWLHKKYPGVDIVNEKGNRLDPVERYMDNTSDPNYKLRGRNDYVNTTVEAKDVPITGTMKGLISGQTWTGTLKLPPMGAELLEAP